MTSQTIVRSVSRAIDILLILALGPMSLREVAVQADLSKGTAHRLLATLAHRGLVIQDTDDGSYVLGPACFRLVDAVTSGIGGLSPVARNTLERLREETQETITLHVRVGGQRICVAELPSQLPVRYIAGVGSSAPVHAGSAGKILLAYQPDDERRRILERSVLAAITDKTPTEINTIEKEMSAIRRAGYAESHGERVPGAGAVSCPVLDPEGTIVAALSVLGPDARITPDRVPELAKTLKVGASEIGTRLADITSDEEQDR